MISDYLEEAVVRFQMCCPVERGLIISAPRLFRHFEFFGFKDSTEGKVRARASDDSLRPIASKNHAAHALVTGRINSRRCPGEIKLCPATALLHLDKTETTDKVRLNRSKFLTNS
jgi:hypothetical protein